MSILKQGLKIGLINFILLQSVYAATVTGLYQANVPITSARLANSKPTLQQGMAQILVKITGNNAIAEQPVIKNALDNPESFLLQYSHKVTEQSGASSESNEIKQNKQLVSTQSYSSERIQNLLKKAGIATWGAQRPLSLAWLVIEVDGRNRIILNETSTSISNNYYKEIVNKTAENRAIPLAYPMQDLEEQVSISSTAVWMQYPEELQRASERYKAEVIVAGRMRKIGSRTWSGQWLLIDKEQMIRFENTSSELNATITEGVNWLADQLALTHATKFAAPSELIKIKINNISNLTAYTDVEKYLSNLAVIETYNVAKVGNNYLELSMNVKNGKKALLDALNLDSKLVEYEANELASGYNESAQGGNVLEFRWRS